ncbi:hypothetical protein [Roseibium sp. MMSF_3544]|uniref:hypothetical protein n=1 Tax=unclassified Roseibium TaxID=2629323 RepID=UPI00273DA662|nr:hypothetical protein [Roseibium sp. MMSF_3544]
MKRPSWSLAGPLALAIAFASGLAFAFDFEKPQDGGCLRSLSHSDDVFVAETTSGTRVSGKLPGQIVIYLPSPGKSKKSPYFSVDKRHRPAWWRSAGKGQKGDRETPATRAHQ